MQNIINCKTNALFLYMGGLNFELLHYLTSYNIKLILKIIKKRKKVRKKKRKEQKEKEKKN